MRNLNPQQKEVAKVFMSNPNREEALKNLMQQYGINQQQVEDIKKIIERR